jgi:hypothetical protein
MLNVQCSVLNVEWPARPSATRSFYIQHSTLNIQHSTSRPRSRRDDAFADV